ncbi:hypothetical protein [uncultured Lacinutrix sp.]|uniref:hypothetical protein n=1 Tax=uncultured Lacinutrix sp. TaxID=574032 RepID=UPI002602CD63|nr:hypothetical protein [uncultured Lacinutrix sp.]
MNTLLIEVGNLDGLILLIAVIMFGPAVILAIIGFLLLKRNKKAAKVFFILAVVYVLVSLGICGSMMA